MTEKGIALGKRAETWARPAYAEQFKDGQIQEMAVVSAIASPQDWPCFWCSRVVDALAFWRLKAQDRWIRVKLQSSQLGHLA